MAFGAIACWFLFLLASVLTGGAVVFRVAVSLSNKCLGPSHFEELDPDDEELDEWIGYRQVRRQLARIPDPGVAKGILCVLWLGVVGVLTSLLMRLLFGVTPFDEHGVGSHHLIVVSHIFAIVIGFPFSAWVLASILPTSFGRACLVLFWIYALLMCLAVALMGIASVV
jgi:hypothetical protein